MSDRIFSAPGERATCWPRCSRPVYSEGCDLPLACLLDWGHRGPCDPSPPPRESATYQLAMLKAELEYESPAYINSLTEMSEIVHATFSPTRNRHAYLSNQPHFGPRQLQVIELVGQGVSNKRIASRLGMAIGTVKHHIRTISQKLDSPKYHQYEPRVRITLFYQDSTRGGMAP